MEIKGTPLLEPGDSARLPAAQRKLLAASLMPMVTLERQEQMRRVLGRRTRSLTMVLEDIYQPQNASAILRTSECLGLQDVYTIENRHLFKPCRGVSRGAERWLSLHRFRHPKVENARRCVESLRAAGYRILAADPRPGAIPLPEVELAPRVALCLGTEWDGLGAILREAADAAVVIPMEGFTASFNVSVSAALAAHILRERMRLELPPDQWELSSEEREKLFLEWLIRDLRQGVRVARRILSGLPDESGAEESLPEPPGALR